jgi:hypothetical protein
LWGLGSLGAWQVGRAARNVHLHDVPDWFHASGPVQVAHTLVANPDCSPALDAVPFEGPSDVRTFCRYERWQSPPLLQPQCILTSKAPTGPPSLSCC